MGCDEMSDPPPSSLLLDTHTLLWMVENHPRLGAGAAGAMNRAGREDRLSISAITLWEIGLLASKQRIDLHRDVMEWVHEVLALPGLSLVQLLPEIAVTSTRLPFEMHPDPADRILVATARRFGATLVTADRALLDLAGSGRFKAMDASR
jgi:PIN domain nuclease of toxin-antitoxin system